MHNDNIKIWKCNVENCTDQYRNKRQIETHILTKHQKYIPTNPEQTKTCPYCNIKLKGLKEITQRLEIIPTENINACQKCPQITDGRKWEDIAEYAQKEYKKEKEKKMKKRLKENKKINNRATNRTCK